MIISIDLCRSQVGGGKGRDALLVKVLGRIHDECSSIDGTSVCKDAPTSSWHKKKSLIYVLNKNQITIQLILGHIPHKGASR